MGTAVSNALAVEQLNSKICYGILINVIVEEVNPFSERMQFCYLRKLYLLVSHVI